MSGIAARIAAGELAERLAGLEPIGLGPRGTNRLAWTAEDAAAGEWFARQAAELGLAVERDPAGSLWAVPDAAAPWWAVGSHLDSVRDGGRFDGALGVAAAFAVAARAARPIAVLSFADEEGARFNTPTFGSRALAGRLDPADVLSRRDDDGVVLRDALAAAGVDPEGLGRAPDGLGRLLGFLELHIDQTRELDAAGAPVGVVTGLASRMRVRAEVRGRADHAGTTPRSERADALAAAARLIVAADELALDPVAGGSPRSATDARADATAGPSRARHPVRVTASRLLVEPNALTTIAARVLLWLDARATGDLAELEAWRTAVGETAGEIADRERVEIGLATQSASARVPFAPEVRDALARAAAALALDAPLLVSWAGHDAGIVAERLPAGMVFVRNPTGISHAPEEEVDLGDAALGASVLLAAVEALQ